METHESIVPAVHNQAEQRFEMDLPEGLAVLEYQREDKKLYLTHTGVPRKAQGKGIAGQLTLAALKWARSQGFQVIPVCSYSVAYIERHPEFSDLL